MVTFLVGRTRINDQSATIIAEAGVNHIGNLAYAERLISEAASAGAHIIKFQTYKADLLTTRTAPRFWSWDGEHDPSGSQYDSYKVLDSFGVSEYTEMFDMCNTYGIEFMSTPFDEGSLEMLLELGMQGIKIASCDITNFGLLSAAGTSGMPVFLSTGASTNDEIAAALEVLAGAGCAHIVLMHCTLCYPTPFDSANLSALSDLQNRFPHTLLGLSDHTLGTAIPIASVALGARVIEKHFTFDKTLPDSADHWLSVDPGELREIVEGTRAVMEGLGSGGKRVLDCEIPARTNARRSLVTSRNLPSGTVLKESDLHAKRPGTGISPTHLSSVVDRVLLEDLNEDELIRWDMLE